LVHWPNLERRKKRQEHLLRKIFRQPLFFAAFFPRQFKITSSDIFESKMNSPPETLCFIENSRAWQKGQIKLDVYFGNMVEHFNGTRHHPGDDERVDKVLFYLDRIGHSVWDCLWDSSLKPVKGSTWMIHFLCVSLVMAPEPS